MFDKQLSEIENSLHLLARQGKQVCYQMERNQAQKPLCERFDLLDNELSNASFAVSLLALTAKAREAALAWLLENSQNLMKIHVPEESGLVELALQERGYVLEKKNGERLEFDRLDTFLSAIETSDLISAGDAENWISPIRLWMQAPVDLQGLVLFIPEDAASLNSPATFNRIVSRTNLLLLAAPSDYEFDEQTRSVVQDLSASMDSVWPIVIHPTEKSIESIERSSQKRIWPKQDGLLRSRLILPSLCLPGSSLPETLGGHRVGKKSKLRQALILAKHSKRLKESFELTAEQFDHNLSKLKEQKKNSEKNLKNQKDMMNSREIAEFTGSIKAYINEETTKLSTTLGENSRNTSLSKGEWGAGLREMIDQLNEDDLSQKDMTQSTKIELSGTLIERIESQISKLVRHQLFHDLSIIRDAREQWAEHTSRELSKYGSFSPVEETRVLDEADLWEKLQQNLDFEVSWRGEIPRIDKKQLFRAAYSPIIMGSMLMSIILPLLGNFSESVEFKRGTFGFALMFVVAFIILLGRGKKSLSKKRNEALEKELNRVKEILRSTAERTVAAVNQEKTRKIGIYLSNFQKEVTKRVEGVASRIGSETKEKAVNEMAIHQSKVSQLDNLSRECMSLSQELNRLKQQSIQTRTQALNLLQDPVLRAEKARI